jgi:hypothetical protein
MTTPSKPIPSGYHYPNIIARQLLTAAEEVLGRSALNAVLTRAGLDSLITTPPPANLRREFDFADFGAICQSIEGTGEQMGDLRLGFKVGQATFKYGMDQFGSPITVGGALLGLRSHNLNTRAWVGMQAMATIFNTFSDHQVETCEHDDHFIYTLKNCSLCWGHTAQRPVCGMGMGLLFEGLKWSTNQDWHTEQVTCRAMGDPVCTYVIRKQSE